MRIELTPLQIATASRERLFGYETLCSMMDWNSSSSSMPSNGGLKEKRVRERAEEFKHRPVGKLITNIMKLKFFESLLKWLQRTSTGGLKCLCTLLLRLSWVLPVLPAFHTAALHKTTSPLLYYRADRPQSGGGKGWRMYEKILMRKNGSAAIGRERQLAARMICSYKKQQGWKTERSERIKCGVREGSCVNELRNNQHTDLDLHLCSQACVFVCLFPRNVRACVCVYVGARRGRWWCAVQRGTGEQSPASGEIYCNSSKMADTGESMGVYIRESIPRGSTARFTISKTHTTVASPPVSLSYESTDRDVPSRLLWSKLFKITSHGKAHIRISNNL